MPSSSYGISVFSAGGSACCGRRSVGVAERRRWTTARPAVAARSAAAPRRSARDCGAAASAVVAHARPASPPRSIQRSSLATSCAALPAVVGVLLEALAHDVVERRRRQRLHGRDRRRLASETIAAIRLVFDLALERAPARRHLVEQRAEREDVGPRVGLLPLELLGRHVLERAEDRPFAASAAWPASAVVGRGRGTTPQCRAPRLREPEVEQLRARLRQHHVAGLEVAMDDPLLVRARRARRRSARRTCSTWSSGSAPFCEPVGERLALEQLHHEEVASVLVADVEERADVRMVERRDRLRLALEALAELRVLGEARGQDLDRDVAVEARVLPRDRPRPCRRRRSAR